MEEIEREGHLAVFDTSKIFWQRKRPQTWMDGGRGRVVRPGKPGWSISTHFIISEEETSWPCPNDDQGTEHTETSPYPRILLVDPVFEEEA
jgi:hypothetical protein